MEVKQKGDSGYAESIRQQGWLLIHLSYSVHHLHGSAGDISTSATSGHPSSTQEHSKACSFNKKYKGLHLNLFSTERHFVKREVFSSKTYVSLRKYEVRWKSDSLKKPHRRTETKQHRNGKAEACYSSQPCYTLKPKPY